MPPPDVTPVPADGADPTPRRRFLHASIWMILGVILGLLTAAYLMAPSPSKKQVQPAVQSPAAAPKRPVAPKKPPAVAPAPTAPAPAPCCNPTPCCTSSSPAAPAPASSVVPPAPPQAVYQQVLSGHPQMYSNDWGTWLVDPNGSFHCPRVDNITVWIGGMEVWVFQVTHPNKGWYRTWAPGCYR